MFKEMKFETIFPRHFVGFDDILNTATKISEEFSKNSSYPPYNIKKLNEDTFVIEIACAGFSSQDLEITVIENKLTVNGTGKQEEANFVYKGIANRNFTREFTLADYVEIESADIVNGILEIKLFRKLPETKKRRTVSIGKQENVKEFLTE